MQVEQQNSSTGEKRIIEFRNITPEMFLKSGEPCPFQIFSIKENYGMHNRIKEFLQEQEKEQPIEEDKVKPVILKVLKISGGQDFSADDFYDEVGFIASLNISAAIIFNSLSFFDNFYKVNKDMIIHVDAMAKRYGKTPMEMFAGDQDYTALDAYLFNSFVMLIGLQNEADQIAKNKKAAARWQTRR